MKLKEFKNSMVWKAADCVEYVDENGVEIEPTTEVQRRKMDNMEVISHETMIDGNITTLEVILGKNKGRVYMKYRTAIIDETGWVMWWCDELQGYEQIECILVCHPEWSMRAIEQ